VRPELVRARKEIASGIRLSIIDIFEENNLDNVDTDLRKHTTFYANYV
jgi:hypothetical protein